jgi:signal transduction histidine kinase
MLNATAADYAYVDINKVDSDGNVTWEIVADAYGDNIPPGPDSFNSGDYSQFPGIIEKMSAGEPTTIKVEDLEMPLRARYEDEGIKSELMAPIMIRGQWVGTIGFTDFWRDDEWSDYEIDALERAADMVAAFWERETASEGLLELAKAKDRFIATVSHELRTPLSAVVGFADTLVDGLDEFSREEVIEMVGLISEQSREVAELVDDLLTAERAASGNITVRPSEIDVRAECETVVAALRTDVFVNIEGHGVFAWADTLRTRQIIRNLLTNASRYGGEAVRIELGEVDGMARVAVFDSGSGVRSLDADLIFDPYYRTSKGESRTDSVGLGLAVARQLARIMGGDLVYQRRQGWTCFELSLPAAKRSVEALTS